MKKLTLFIYALALLPSIAFATYLLWPKDYVVLAPDYIVDLIEKTEVKWALKNDEIGGDYHINHAGNTEHHYVTILSIQSNKGNFFIWANSTPMAFRDIKQGGWSNIAPDIRHRIDWPSAKVRLDIRVFNANNNLIFHGVKLSDKFKQ
jgi:hypothetical protein